MKKRSVRRNAPSGRHPSTSSQGDRVPPTKTAADNANRSGLKSLLFERPKLLVGVLWTFVVLGATCDSRNAGAQALDECSSYRSALTECFGEEAAARIWEPFAQHLSAAEGSRSRSSVKARCEAETHRIQNSCHLPAAASSAAAPGQPRVVPARAAGTSRAVPHRPFAPPPPFPTGTGATRVDPRLPQLGFNSGPLGR
jgi:hypothetical protein